MKQTLQLRLGQHLTMTPQLQQAIRLLQLSTLDLQQEVQDALETNPLLEMEEDGEVRESASSKSDDGAADNQDTQTTETAAPVDADRELNTTDTGELPDDLPVDSEWSDVYENYTPTTALSQPEAPDTDFLAQRSSAQTLQDHLLWQMNLSHFQATDLVIATAIIDAINEDGYLRVSTEDILAGLRDKDLPQEEDDVLSLEEVEAVLHRVHQFDPPGVGARNPQECLLIQLQQLPADTPYREPATRLCRDHFDLLAAQDQTQIRRRLKVNDEELREITRLIRSLNPRPGSLIAVSETQYVVPEVFVSKRNGTWHVELNAEATPRIRVNASYAGMIRRADQSADNTYLKNHLQEARWFIKSLVSRNETVLRVAGKIVEFQRGYFEHGEEAMRPLVLRDIAEALDMHESTISRVTTQKYMHTPRGTLEFKYFFSSHVSTSAGGECSATAIRALIKKLVAAEQPNKPLSDNKIAAILADQGIEVARRTVAKYREAMGVPPSNERKRLL